MSFRIRYDAEQRLVRLLFYGEATFDSRIEAIRQLAARYGHLKPLRILADVRKVSKMSMSKEEQIAFGWFVGGQEALKNAHIAVLNKPQLNTTAVMRNAARQQGLELFSFLTEAEALEWLASRNEVPG
ncbi:MULTISPECIES: hypothetical protein [Microbulbifer]|uniref:STAS/SEC14 domain-containing protein n=1 Tax=Microbulbifer celer TaxID=435905 RepID=A0ABW3U2R5_9GAMM|nr:MULTISPECIES: hypothetical protein [Microbulbifer]UFN56133.1 hypothetical protein LPW13_11160 [Microbulbifer celer]